MTPYALVFANERFESQDFPAIAAEAESRGIDASDPDQFVMLGIVGTLLRDLSGSALPAQPPDAARLSTGEPDPRLGLRMLAALLFQAYHFWRFDRRVYTLEDAHFEALLARTIEIGSWQLAPPQPAGYIKLPRHRLWSRIEQAATPEPVDGLFWTMIGHPDPAAPPYARLDVLLALGMHPGRPGLSVIEVGVTLPAEPARRGCDSAAERTRPEAARPELRAPAGHWADIRAREEGDDFANVLPGGELSGLHALTNTAEVLKLVSRVFFDLSHQATTADLARDG
jgi:hypothetical protein